MLSKSIGLRKAKTSTISLFDFSSLVDQSIVVLSDCSPNKCQDKSAPLLAGVWDTSEVAISDAAKIMLQEQAT